MLRYPIQIAEPKKVKSFLPNLGFTDFVVMSVQSVFVT